MTAGHLIHWLRRSRAGEKIEKEGDELQSSAKAADAVVNVVRTPPLTAAELEAPTDRRQTAVQCAEWGLLSAAVEWSGRLRLVELMKCGV
jgi:hypothetical protein